MNTFGFYYNYSKITFNILRNSTTKSQLHKLNINYKIFITQQSINILTQNYICEITL